MKEMEMKCAQEESHMIYTRVMLLCPTSDIYGLQVWILRPSNSFLKSTSQNPEIMFLKAPPELIALSSSKLCAANMTKDSV